MLTLSEESALLEISVCASKVMQDAEPLLSRRHLLGLGATLCALPPFAVGLARAIPQGKEASMKILRTTSPVVTVTSEILEATVEFYEKLLGERAKVRFKNPTGALDLVLIASMLIIGGSEGAIATRKGLMATFTVNSLAAWREALVEMGATVVEPPKAGPMSPTGPIGNFMFVRHPDGSLFEYFQSAN